jgi:hypothetical protein
LTILWLLAVEVEVEAEMLAKAAEAAPEGF